MLKGLKYADFGMTWENWKQTATSSEKMLLAAGKMMAEEPKKATSAELRMYLTIS